jgi:uncharacterized protein (DUF1330 family)
MEEPMAAYFVFHIRVHDEAKMQEYYSKADKALAPHKHEMLVFDDHSEVMEGNMTLPRTIVLKFDSREAALAWYNSPAYQAARPVRLAATESFTVLVDGQ